MRPATIDNWIDACGQAWGELCNGSDGAYVGRWETWEVAIVIRASAILVAHGLGRARGPVPNQWEAVVRAFADRDPFSPDGLVEGERGVRFAVRSLDRSPRPEQIH